MSLPFAEHVRVAVDTVESTTAGMAEHFVTCRGCGVMIESQYAASLGWHHTVQDCLQRFAEENEAMRARLDRLERGPALSGVDFGMGGGRGF